MFFVVFHAFRNLYTPPKTPFFPTGPASLLVVFRGFPPHIIDTRALNSVFVVILMVFSCKSRCVRIVNIYRNCGRCTRRLAKGSGTGVSNSRPQNLAHFYSIMPFY